MKKKFLLIVTMSLALAACQDDKAPAAKAPAEPTVATTTTENIVADAAKKAPVLTEQKQLPVSKNTVPANTVSASDAVAVTKPAETQTAQSVQAAMHQASAEVKAKIEAIQLKPAAVKETVAKQAAIVAAKAAPAAKPVIAPKAVAVAKSAPKAAPKVAIVAAPVKAAVQAAMAGDAARGKSLARKCKACHNFTAKKKVGPGLKGVFGRKAGTMPGMRYSPALAAGDWVWNEKNLALWICDSKKAVKTLSGNASAKTKMGAQRFCDAGKQADIIAFLKTL